MVEGIAINVLNLRFKGAGAADYSRGRECLKHFLKFILIRNRFKINPLTFN